MSFLTVCFNQGRGSDERARGTIKTVTVTNKSKAPLTIYSVGVTSTDGSATAEFNVTGGSCGSTGYPHTVGPSPDTCTITVSFTPSAISASNGRTGTLTITDDAPAGTQTINMEGTGTADVTTSPASVTITNEEFGKTVTKYVTITNKQSQSVTLTPSIAQTATGFALAAGGTCDGTILAPTVPAASSCTIAYSYSPSALNSESGTLTIIASPDLAPSPYHTVALSATTVPDTVTPTSLVYGDLLLTDLQTKTVTVTNKSPFTLSLSDSIGGTDPADFTILGGCGSTLAPNSYCSIAVAFSPTETGTRSAALAVTITGDPTSPHDVSLKGTGM